MSEPHVPSRTWPDPLLGSHMSTGLDAEQMAAAFIERTPPDTLLATDIETPGFERAFTINCVTMAWEWPTGGVHSILLDPRRNAKHARLVRDMYEHAGRIVLHNAPFDIPVLYQRELMTRDQIDKVVDTLVLARFALPEPPPFGPGKKLEQLATRYLGLSEFKGGMERAFKAAGYKTIAAGFEGLDIGSPIYRQGAMADTVATLRLEPLLRAMCINWTLDHPFDFYGATSDAEAERILGEQETVHRVMLRRSAKGLAVDTAYLERYQEEVDVERNLAIAELAAHGLEGGTGKGKALVDYLDSRGELPQPWPRTPKGSLRATKADMEVLAEINPLAGAQRRLAEIDKVMGYLEKVARQAEVTGRCHPQVATLGASATGRMSYGSPELQQFSGPARAIICDDGQGLTSIDWSQIEPVTMGNMARDLDFLAPYEAGLDLYEPLQLAAGLPLTKDGRQSAKVLLLSTMYGAGIAKIAAQIGHTEESAAQIRRQMFSKMKRCERWMFKVEEIARGFGCVVTIGGRILPVDEGGVFKAVNYSIQGSAYDVLARTITTMEERGLGDHLQLAMHDEVVVDTEVAEEVQEIMATPPDFLLKWTGGRVPVLRTDRADMGAAWAKV